MLEVNSPVSVLDAIGIIVPGYKLYDTIQDRNGLIGVLNQDDKVIRIHPGRMYDGNISGSIITFIGNDAVACCPGCHDVITVKVGGLGSCPACGEFKIIGATQSSATPKQQEEKPVAVVNDVLEQLSQLGEIWVKDVPFDNPSTHVVSVGMRHKNRYMFFNLYNNTYGKANKRPPIEQLLAGKHGYKLDDEDKWHKKLMAKGYKKN